VVWDVIVVTRCRRAGSNLVHLREETRLAPLARKAASRCEIGDDGLSHQQLVLWEYVNVVVRTSEPTDPQVDGPTAEEPVLQSCCI
jgi:hypothetical protein